MKVLKNRPPVNEAISESHDTYEAALREFLADIQASAEREGVNLLIVACLLAQGPRTRAELKAQTDVKRALTEHVRSLLAIGAVRAIGDRLAAGEGELVDLVHRLAQRGAWLAAREGYLDDLCDLILCHAEGGWHACALASFLRDIARSGAPTPAAP